MSARPHTDPPWRVRRFADGLLVVLMASLSLSTTGMQIAVVGLVVLSIAAVVCRWNVVRRTPLDGALGLFLGVCAVSTLASWSLRDAVDWASMWILCTYVVVFWWLRDHEHANRLARTIVRAAALAAVYGIVQHFTGIDWYRQLLGRPLLVRPRAPGEANYAVVGFFRSYLTFGHAMLPPFALATAGAVRGHWTAAAVAALLSVAVVYSTARGAWLGMAAIVVVVGMLAGKRVWGMALVLFLVMGGVLAGSRDLRTEARHMFTLGGVNAPRLEIYAANLDIIREHPLLGLCFGRHRTAALPYYEAHPLADRRSHAHNNYLQIAAEAGLLGLAAFMAVYAVALRRGWEGLGRASISPGRQVLLVGTWAAIIGFMIGGVTQYTFGDSEVALASWVMLALLLRAAEDTG